MGKLISSPTAQDTTNSYGCSSGVIPEGKFRYKLAGLDRKKLKKAHMIPLPLSIMNDKIICDSKKSKLKTTQPKI